MNVWAARKCPTKPRSTTWVHAPWYFIFGAICKAVHRAKSRSFVLPATASSIPALLFNPIRFTVSIRIWKNTEFVCQSKCTLLYPHAVESKISKSVKSKSLSPKQIRVDKNRTQISISRNKLAQYDMIRNSRFIAHSQVNFKIATH